MRLNTDAAHTLTSTTVLVHDAVNVTGKTLLPNCGTFLLLRSRTSRRLRRRAALRSDSLRSVWNSTCLHYHHKYCLLSPGRLLLLLQVGEVVRITKQNSHSQNASKFKDGFGKGCI